MARIVLTNDKLKFNFAVNKNVAAGFDDYETVENDGVFLSAHKKRIKKIDNILELGNGDFCTITGTCIYKETVGDNALRLIYEDYRGDIEELRNRAIGNYVITLKKGEEIVVFVDKYQILKAYYYNKRNDWFITNSLADIGNVLDDMQINEFAFMQETMLVGSIGNQSIFNDVFRLFGHQCIKINTAENNFEIMEIPYKRERRNFEGRSIESAVDEYAEIIKTKFSAVANIWGDNIRIHQTGGLDNRTVFSAFMSVGCRPNIMYGVGNSIITGTRNEDLMLCKEYSKRFDLDLYEMNWKEDYLSGNEHWQALFNRHGFNYTIYGCNRNFLSQYEGLIPDYPDFMECGYFGENLRTREWATGKNKSIFAIDEVVDQYLLGGAYGRISGNRTFYANYENLREEVINIISEFVHLYRIDNEKGVSLADFDQLRWIHSRNSDSVTVNFLNDFAPSIAMFSLPELHEFPFDVPASWRAEARFQLMLIDKLCPQVLEVPIFSHCRTQALDKVNYKLTPRMSKIEEFRNFLKNIGLSEGALKNIAGIFYKIVGNKNKTGGYSETKELKGLILPIINNLSEPDLKFIEPELYNGSIIYLLRYVQYLYGVRLIANSLER